MNTISSDAGLSRKEMLKKWRAQREAGAALISKSINKSENPAGASARSQQSGKESRHTGALAERCANTNRTYKKPASRSKKGAVKRKPFQVDASVVREASERRVAPGTPINMLKKRIKRAAAAAAAAAAGVPAQSTAGGQHGGSFRPTVGAKATVAATGGGRTQVGGGTVYVSKGLSRAARTKHGNVGGASSHILDAARMKKVSEYLKSQISEANMLLEIAGVDAARTLLADLLFCTGDGRGVGELALYWAARAKLEEDAGFHSAARRTLDEGQAYISMPMQQKVMEKVLSAFETRMNDRAEADVVRLLNSSGSSGGSHGNSPTSCTPFRYDPNDLSMEDDVGVSNVGSAIKNLNFSRIASAEDSGDSTSREKKLQHHYRQRQKTLGRHSPVSSSSLAGGGMKLDVADENTAGFLDRSGGSDALSGVVYSDDDSDLSISDIDEGVLARAKAFTDEEEARNARISKEQDASSSSASAGSDAKAEVSQMSAGKEEETKQVAEEGRENKGTTMPPPDSQPSGSGQRKGTPHPKNRSSTDEDEKGDGGSFLAQVESKDKDGKRTLTPVRRSRRFNTAKEPTPSPLRKEMEALL